MATFFCAVMTAVMYLTMLVLLLGIVFSLFALGYMAYCFIRDVIEYPDMFRMKR